MVKLQQWVLKEINKVKRMVGGVVLRTLISAVDTTDGIAGVRIEMLGDETQEGVDLMQQYGYTSSPPAGSEGIAVFPGGKRNGGVIIATENGEFRLKNLKPGETALYTQWGDKLHFKEGRIVDFETETLNIKATKKVSIDSPAVECTGELADSVGKVSGLRTAFNTHVHPGNLGAPTGPANPQDTGS